MIKLSPNSTSLLMKCLENYRPDLIETIKKKELVEVDEELGNNLREAVSNELLQHGFDGDVPNEYGLALEGLIDDIGRLYL